MSRSFSVSDKIYLKDELKMEKFLPEQIDKLKFHGRRSKLQPFCLFWSNSGVEMNIKATELYVTVNCNYNFAEPWIEYEVNGALISRIRLEKGENRICIFRAFDKSAMRNVQIYRDSQPFMWNNELVEITSIETDGEFFDVSDRKYKFEFYGDSITSGEGLCGAVGENDFATMYISSMNTYERQMAKAFDADIQSVSQCGWGVIGGWNNSPFDAVPKCFDRVCAVVQSSEMSGKAANEEYDFDGFKSDAVIINLGTNDNTAFTMTEFKDDKGNVYKIEKDNPDDEKKFKDGVKDFLRKIRAKNPDAVIIWSIGIISADYAAGLIEDAVNALKSETKDEKMYYLKFEPMGKDDFGSRWHPGLPAHRQMAEQLGSLLKRVL